MNIVLSRLMQHTLLTSDVALDGSFWFYRIDATSRCSTWARSKYRHSRSHSVAHSHTLTREQSAQAAGRAEVSQLKRRGDRSGENNPPSHVTTRLCVRVLRVCEA